MRRIIAPVFILFVFALSSCNFDLYDGKRPFDYGSAKWVCEEPSTWFVVDKDADEYYYPKGEITVDNQSVQVGFRFVNQTNRVFIDLLDSINVSDISGYNVAIDGECVFSPEKLTIVIDKETDTRLCKVNMKE